MDKVICSCCKDHEAEHYVKSPNINFEFVEEIDGHGTKYKGSYWNKKQRV
jgi:hypothetical protein